MKKIKINILVSFICLLFANSLFAQVNPHDRMVKRMKDSGLANKEIEYEINEINSFYQKQIDQEFDKIENEIIKNNKKSETQRLACTDIPASEKDVLYAIFDNLNGSTWATNWDFNTSVTSWDPSTETGWYGIQVDANCNVISLSFNLPNSVYGNLPDLSNLTMLKSLSILTGSGLYGHTIPFYVTGDFSSIGNLSHLENLFLFNFDFEGNLPSSFLNLKNTIKQFRLGHCNLNNNSQLCSVIGQFNNLTLLGLGHNFYSGDLPVCFSSNDFPFLQTLTMQSNNITDISILSSHSNLNVVWFGNNDISGDFPDLSNNLNLYSTILELNDISGEIPYDFPSNIYVLKLGWNNLNGTIPFLNKNPQSNYWEFRVLNNKFNFKDLENNFNHYLNNFTSFQYAPQAKTDAMINDNVSVGSSYTMTMHEDGNYSSVETYQWYKGTYPSGTAIAGATSRQYILPSVQLTDAGSYYCLSTHPSITIPSDSFKNLILQREQINLNVVNCSPITGEIIPLQDYECGSSFTTGYSFSNYGANDQYSWTFLDPSGNVIATSNLSGTDPVTFNQPGINTVNLELTTPNGCTYNFSYQVELVDCEPEPVCETHISFNYATPNGILNNNIRLELGTGIVNFINENLNNQLYITSIDDFSGGGVRFRPAQQTFTAPWDQPFLNASNEVKANANLSIQNDNYSNTIINELNGILNNATIDKKINITFLLASQDVFSNISDVQLAYNNLINSGKTDKIFFIFFENGVFRNSATNTSLSPVDFVNSVLGSSAVNFDTTGSVVDSNYKVFTTSEYINTSFDQLVQQFMQNAYDDIIDVSCDGEPCLDIVGQIVSRNTTFCVGEKIDFGFSTSDTIVSYSWSAIEVSTGNVLSTYPFGDIFTVSFPNPGDYTINIEVINDQGCSSQFIYNVRVVSCTDISCTKDNQNSQVVKQLFINLLNHLKSQASVPNGYTCAELLALAPYITDADPKVYNYSNSNSTTQFWFHPVQGKDTPDVLLQKWNPTYPDVLEIDLSNYQDPNSITNLNGLVRLTNNSIVERSHVRHIDFCPKEIEICTKNNPNSQIVEGLLIELVHELIQMKLSGVPNSAIEGTTPVSLFPLSQYITDSNPKIWNFDYGIDRISFSFSKEHKEDVVFEGHNSNFNNATSSNFELDLSSYTDPEVGITLSAYQYDVFRVKKIIIKHIDFCPDETVSCTATNPNSQVVKELFKDLVNFLITQNNLPDGYTCPQLVLLAPYVQPDDPVAIYNFTNPGNYISFSFSDHGEDFDVQIPYYNSGITINDFGLQNYIDFGTSFQIDTHLSSGYVDTFKGFVRHIEFCPDELYCKHHVAIVVDESGSIDFMEAAIIREQLKSFINKQINDNNTLGTNMHVSLIGLSDSDSPTSRTDHIIGNQKIDNSNKGDYLAWISNYKRSGNGVSPSSDYWRGGLEKALQIEPDLVILITDGCQTTNSTNLQTTIKKFNNNQNSSGPHLFVVGLDNGFYVDSDTSLNRNKLSMNEDPNYNPELTRISETGRVTSFLRKSLKYLMEYNGSDFPIKDKYNFISNQSNEMVDYYGANDFRFLRDEINYLSNGLVTDPLIENNIELSCGDKVPLEECNNCLNFKPIPGKEYILSAWVKEEQNFQVMSYLLPKINIRFYDYTKENEISSGSPVECTTKGDIIDDWQRIFKKFVVPTDAVYISIELVNPSESVPVYFDDIRIHPVDGSMKSFVYDPETFRLMSELDENNYSTFYEYDKEGGLIRVKKETSRGVKTIQETRSGNVIKE